jgi:hypothetical protein
MCGGRGGGEAVDVHPRCTSENNLSNNPILTVEKRSFPTLLGRDLSCYDYIGGICLRFGSSISHKIKIATNENKTNNSDNKQQHISTHCSNSNSNSKQSSLLYIYTTTL